MPEKSTLPSAVRGAGPSRTGLPSAVRGTPGVGYDGHCAATVADMAASITITIVLTCQPPTRTSLEDTPLRADECYRKRIARIARGTGPGPRPGFAHERLKPLQRPSITRQTGCLRYEDTPDRAGRFARRHRSHARAWWTQPRMEAQPGHDDHLSPRALSRIPATHHQRRSRPPRAELPPAISGLLPRTPVPRPCRVSRRARDRRVRRPLGARGRRRRRRTAGGHGPHHQAQSARLSDVPPLRVLPDGVDPRSAGHDGGGGVAGRHQPRLRAAPPHRALPHAHQGRDAGGQAGGRDACHRGDRSVLSPLAGALRAFRFASPARSRTTTVPWPRASSACTNSTTPSSAASSRRSTGSRSAGIPTSGPAGRLREPAGALAASAAGLSR